MNMAQYAKPTEPRSTVPSSANRDRQRVPDFKPVALPALKAAVQAMRTEPRRPERRELPAILRKDSDAG
jgi:hypothetical protein